jgi:hypothetical protein
VSTGRFRPPIINPKVLFFLQNLLPKASKIINIDDEVLVSKCSWLMLVQLVTCWYCLRCRDLSRTRFARLNDTAFMAKPGATSRIDHVLKYGGKINLTLWTTVGAIWIPWPFRQISMSQRRTIDINCVDENEPIRLNCFFARQLSLLRRLQVHLLSRISARTNPAGTATF